MFKPTAIAIPLLTLFLAACGGGGGGDPVAGGSASGSENDENISNPDGETVQTGTEVGTPRLGIGSGSSFQQGQLTVENSQLGAGASTNISATIVDVAADNAKIVSKNYGVVFTSTCSESQPPQAGFSNASTITSGGEVTVTYTASGCSGTDTVTFRLYEVNASNEIQVASLLSTAVATLNVAQAEVGELRFVTNDTPAIGLNGVGNDRIPATAKVTFKVVDQTGSPIAKKEVNFSVFPGSSFAELSLTSNVTDDNGDVSVFVTAGSTPAQIRVRATTTLNDNSTIEVDSLPISISTGLVSQEGFSLAADIFNPAGYNADGATINLSVTAYDYTGNPAPDGTNILFAAENGFVNPSSCQTTAGRCSVEWLSGGLYRPGDDELVNNLKRANELNPSGSQVKGMTTITAYALGEANFSDLNANNLYDDGEPFESFPEAFVDNNNNGTFDQLDPNDTDSVLDHLYFDIDESGTYSSALSTTYQGVLCSDDAKEQGHCSRLVHVRDSVRIMQSVKDSISIRLYTVVSTTQINDGVTTVTNTYTEATPTLVSSGFGSLYVVLQDSNGNIPATGAILDATAEGFVIEGGTGVVSNSVGEIPIEVQSGDRIVRSVGLPPYGQLYRVLYSVDGTPEKLTLKATSGNRSESVILTP